MKTYELTYIVSSAQTAEEAESVRKEVEIFITEKGGVIVRSDKITAQTLAYPIKRYGSGFFSTLEFQAEEKEIPIIRDKAQKHPGVLRQTLVVKRPVKQAKERRTRPVRTKPSVPVSTEDIDKKLDEILGE